MHALNTVKKFGKMDELDRKKRVVVVCENRKVLDKEVIGHKFPANRAVGLKWVESTGNEKLKALPYECITSKRYFICRDHFNENDMFKTPRGLTMLHRHAVPTLNLPAPSNCEGHTSCDIDAIIDLADDAVTKDLINLTEDPIFSSPGKGKLEVSDSSPGADIRRSSLHFENEVLEKTKIDDGELERITVEEGPAIEIEGLERPAVEVQVSDNDASKIPVEEALTSTPKHRNIENRRSCRTAWRTEDLTSPTKKRLYSQLSAKREENSKLKKKFKRYQLAKFVTASTTIPSFETKYTK